MKNNVLKTFLSISIIAITLSTTGCRKKFDEPDPKTYDQQNRIFRVKVNSSDNAPFKLSIQRVNKNPLVDPIDLLEIDQRTGAAFEYGFTPAIGETITVKVSSIKQNINAYSFYKGADTWRVDLTEKTTVGFAGSFTYQVAN